MEQAGIAKGGPCDGLAMIGPYYPGRDAGARQASQIAEANHESNIKVLNEVQQNTSDAADFSTAQMKAL